MTVALKTVTEWLDGRLMTAQFSRDHSNNGLQIEGRSAVSKVVGGVDGCLGLFEAARGAGADLVLVHHGLSWGGEPRRWTGWVAKRFGALFQHDISLYASHLPLDAHPECGNNAILADRIDLRERQPFFVYDGVPIGWTGRLTKPLLPEQLAAEYARALPAQPRLFGMVGRPVARVAVVSGGGGLDGVIQAAEAGTELFITGEMEHVMFQAAQELGLGVLALGHYASETVGVKRLLEELATQFGLRTEFIDLPTGL